MPDTFHPPSMTVRNTVYILRTRPTAAGASFHYHCGDCGSLLLDAGTKELLDCAFHCVACGSLNEGHEPISGMPS